jgi:hypothetical protein
MFGYQTARTALAGLKELIASNDRAAAATLQNTQAQGLNLEANIAVLEALNRLSALLNHIETNTAYLKNAKKHALEQAGQKHVFGIN